MKLILVLIGLLTIIGVALFNQKTVISKSEQGEEQSPLDKEILIKYEEWKQKYSKNTNSNAEAESYRFSQFKENYNFVKQHNMSEEFTFTLELNQFAAMSNQEFRETMLNLNRPENKLKMANAQEFPQTDAPLSDQVDWVKKGKVYPTQNQGTCGSCWAFSTVGGLQSLRAIVDNKLEQLSVQQITSCVPKEYLDDKTQGCGGGLPEYAYQYTADAGIELGSTYPYTDGDSKVASPCLYNKAEVVFHNEGVGFVPQKDVKAMKQNLQNQPLSIGVDAGSIYFQLYSTGIINTDFCGDSINHSILLVGYDTTNEEAPYWQVQNSWGPDWGNKGYGKIGISEGQGYCMINMEVNFPTSVQQQPTSSINSIEQQNQVVLE